MSVANVLRGEASLVLGGVERIFRPTFAALVAAEGEIGPLFAAVERAAAGHLKLDELVALLWHTLSPDSGPLTRAQFADAVVEVGLAVVTPVLKTLLTQALQGR
ncbi:MAG: gene transfer agent family protein [Janthinobacterium lividum]